MDQDSQAPACTITLRNGLGSRTQGLDLRNLSAHDAEGSGFFPDIPFYRALKNQTRLTMSNY